MIEIGRLCVKLAGRDSNKKCLIIDVIDDNTVMIEGQTRRRKCNVKHLEPLDKVFKVAKNASFSEVAKVFKTELDIELKQTKPKKAAEKPKKIRKKKEKPETAKKETKKTTKKEETKKAEPKAQKTEAPKAEEKKPETTPKEKTETKKETAKPAVKTETKKSETNRKKTK